MPIGPILKQARIEKKMTASQVAKETNMMVQIVEDLERDDYHRIAAPIYGKGFIKLYAEAVELDPQPLTKEYMATLNGAVSEPASLLTSALTPDVPAKETAQKASEKTELNKADRSTAEPAAERDLFSFAAGTKRRKPASLQPEQPHSLRQTVLDTQKDEVDTKAMADSWIKSQWLKIGELSRVAIKGVSDRFAAAQIRELPLRAITLLICLAAVLFFVVSGISQCSRSAQTQADNGDDELTIAIDMPDPYFD